MMYFGSVLTLNDLVAYIAYNAEKVLLVSDDIVHVQLGPRWTGSVDVVRLLAPIAANPGHNQPAGMADLLGRVGREIPENCPSTEIP